MLKYTVENERKQRCERQGQDIELAKEKGKYQRSPLDYCADLTEKQKRVTDKKIDEMLEKIFR